MATDPIDPIDRFDDVYARTRDPLARYLARRCSPDAVEDLFQDVMTIAWRRLADIPHGDEVPWLIGVARRTLGNRRRAQVRFGRLLERLRLVDAWKDAGTPPRLGPDAELADALATLAPDDGDILRLWAWDELAPREIGVVLGISPNAASIRLFRAKGRLRGALERQERAARKNGRLVGHEVGVEHEEAR